MKQNIILFGAGEKGKQALRELGERRVAFFCDNSTDKVGSKYCNKKVISFDKMVELHSKGYILVLTPMNKVFLRAQVEKANIFDYIEYVERDNRLPDELADINANIENAINCRLDYYVEASKKMDLIESTVGFQKLVKELFLDETLKNQGLFAYRGKQGESNHYGNLEAIVDYAQLDENQIDCFPIVSHFNIYKDLYPIYSYQTSAVFMGDYYKKEIHKRLSYIPIFSIGPYIHYATDIYSSEKIKRIKKEKGKILTAFLPHSIECGEKKFEEEAFVNKVISLYKKEFDEIWLCVYWADINKSVCKYAEEKGMHIVCAGFRFDNYFDRRLKTIMNISDATVCAEMGTNVIYSLYMKKPVGRIDIYTEALLDVTDANSIEKDLRTIGKKGAEIEKFNQLFNEELKITQEQIDFLDEMAGFSNIKSPEYIRNIFEISKKIWTCCEGKKEDYYLGVMKAYQSFYIDGEFEKMQMLKAATGAFL